VKARLSSQQGISFTEFTYQLLQAYDFYHLNKNHGCTIQVGGSDQWGNIIAGIELIGKLAPSSSEQSQAQDAFGITTPLLTTPSGEKFGKSAGNAVWLDENLTSVFDFYQAGLHALHITLSSNARRSTSSSLPTQPCSPTSNCSHSCRVTASPRLSNLTNKSLSFALPRGYSLQKSQRWFMALKPWRKCKLSHLSSSPPRPRPHHRQPLITRISLWRALSLHSLTRILGWYTSQHMSSWSRPP